MSKFQRILAIAVAILIVAAFGVLIANIKSVHRGDRHGMFFGMMRDGGMGGRGMMGRGMMGEGIVGGMMGQGMMDGNGMDGGELSLYLRYADNLKLTVDQVKKLKDRRTALEKEAIDLHAKLQVGRIELRELLDQDSVNIGDVEKKVRSNQDLTANLVIATIKANTDARNILTPNQRKKVDELKHTAVAYIMKAWKPGMGMRGARPGKPENPERQEREESQER